MIRIHIPTSLFDWVEANRPGEWGHTLAVALETNETRIKDAFSADQDPYGLQRKYQSGSRRRFREGRHTYHSVRLPRQLLDALDELTTTVGAANKQHVIVAALEFLKADASAGKRNHTSG